MKRLVLIVLSVLLFSSLMGCRNTITYTKPYRLEGTGNVDDVKAGGMPMTREYIAREVYYTLDPNYTGYPIYVRMVDAARLDLPNPIWGELDSEFAEYDRDAVLAPNLKMIWPLKPGETMIRAEQDGYEATAKMVVLPVYRPIIGEGWDIDGDGIEDILRPDKMKCIVPHGATKLPIWGHPIEFGSIPADSPAPAVESVEFDFVECPSPAFYAIMNASGGGVYATRISPGSTYTSIAYIKLR